MASTFIYVGNTRVGESLVNNLLCSGLELATQVEDADVVFVYCEVQTDLEDVFFDSAGLVQTAKKDAFLVNLSASTPSFARELSAVAIVNDLKVVEAPLVVEDVTLEHAFASADNLFGFVAGEEPDIAEVSPLLDCIAKTWHHTGVSGSAQLARAAITLQTASQLISCLEADALYRANSADSATTIQNAFDLGIVTERALRLLGAVRTERFEGDYTVQICMTELVAALMAADDVELILPGAEACMHLLELLAVIGGSDMSTPALSLVYGEESLCAKHGLDWTRAEKAYADEDEECDHDHSSEKYSGGFGGFSSN